MVELGGSLNEFFDCTDVVSSVSTMCKASLGWTYNVEHVSLQPLVHVSIQNIKCMQSNNYMDYIISQFK